jgi:hypothetical protein
LTSGWWRRGEGAGGGRGVVEERVVGEAVRETTDGLVVAAGRR